MRWAWLRRLVFDFRYNASMPIFFISVDQHFKLTKTASNIVRMARILFAAPQGALQ